MGAKNIEITAGWHRSGSKNVEITAGWHKMGAKPPSQAPKPSPQAKPSPVTPPPAQNKNAPNGASNIAKLHQLVLVIVMFAAVRQYELLKARDRWRQEVVSLFHDKNWVDAHVVLDVQKLHRLRVQLR